MTIRTLALFFGIAFLMILGRNLSAQNVFFNSCWLEECHNDKRISSPTIPIVDVDETDPREVLEFVLQNCPETCKVYPTEQYFYFRFQSGPRLISGNLRFCNSKAGIVNFGYFDEFDRDMVYHGAIQNGENGKVTREGSRVSVSYQGISRVFEIESPLSATTLPNIKDPEVLIAHIVDESGYEFDLIFNSGFNGFYYLLSNAPESLSPLREFEKVSVGIHSRFAFFADNSGRLILIGVANDEVRKNSYFDGPFDQVPPFLDIRDKLLAAYPYLELQGGIDQHGNFKNVANMRVAVSPYLQYKNLTDLLSLVESKLDLTNDRFQFSEIVHESKMDFHEKVGRTGQAVFNTESSVQKEEPKGKDRINEDE